MSVNRTNGILEGKTQKYNWGGRSKEYHSKYEGDWSTGLISVPWA